MVFGYAMNRLLIFFLASIAFSQEPQSPSDSEPWIVIDPLAAEDKYDDAKAQFSNDPNFASFVEGRVGGRHPDRRFSGPYVDGVDDNYYRYARTKKSWMIGWMTERRYSYINPVPKIINGQKYYDAIWSDVRVWPPGSEQLKKEVKRYFDEQFQEQQKRAARRIAAEDYQRKQDGLRRKKQSLEKELAEINSQIE